MSISGARALAILGEVREKRGNSALETFQGDRASRVSDAARRDILNMALTTLGVGAGARGLLGLKDVLQQDDIIPEEVPSDTVEMPVRLGRSKALPAAGVPPIKAASAPTDPTGLGWYAPGLLLGGTLGAYGGWKGVDTLLDQHRQSNTAADLEEAKAEYAAALEAAHSTKLATEKTAGDKLAEALDDLYAAFTKVADGPAIDAGLLSRVKKTLSSSGVPLASPPAAASPAAAPATGMIDKLHSWFDDSFPNLKGQATNAAALWALPTAGAGYAVVDAMMGQNSQRKLLQRALQERARRHTAQRPAELYAVPIDESENGEN